MSLRLFFPVGIGALLYFLLSASNEVELAAFRLGTKPLVGFPLRDPHPFSSLRMTSLRGKPTRGFVPSL